MNLKDYEEAQRKAAYFNREQRRITEEKDTKERAVRDKYWDLKRDLEDKERKEKDVIEESYNSQKQNLEEKATPYYEIIKATQRIFKLIDIHVGSYLFFYLIPRDELPLYISQIDEYEKEFFELLLKGNNWPEPFLKPLSYEYYTKYDDKGEYIGNHRVVEEPFHVCVNDKYKNLGFFIVESGKPTNKYSLRLIGHSIFKDSGTFERGNPFYDEYTIEIKDLLTKKALMEYFERNKKKIFNKYQIEESIALHEKTEQEYEHALELFKSPEWFLAWLEYKKDYYTNHYSGGTQTKEYKAIVQKITECENLAKLTTLSPASLINS